MKGGLFGSFRVRLFVAFLAATLVPLLACSGLLLETFRARMDSDARQEAQSYLKVAASSLDELYYSLEGAAEAVGREETVLAALGGQETADTAVNAGLFAATRNARGYARFDLYDGAGNWRYSTGAPPAEPTLPLGWGCLGAAEREGRLVFLAAEDAADTLTPRLQGAVALSGTEGERVGYLVVSVYQSHLRSLLEGKYGRQNDLLLLSRYWRPVYCARPSLVTGLAPTMRERLLAGESLGDGTGEFIFSAARQEATGLYIVLRQPQVFTKDIMGLSYTLSATMALIGVLLSVILALALSRQFSLPVRRLTQAMGRVRENDLEVRVAPVGRDELGELTENFNGMVAALKQNQEELVDNQRELNEAQIRMLQAQLNPHFLCNTLDTMKWISKINRVPQVAEMSADLADILRYSISPGERVPLWRELEILERYIHIQTVRLSGRLAFLADIPEELGGCLVPKLVLQPIVENAILHGLAGIQDGGVVVKAREEAGRLVITVSDNGKGLPEELVGPYVRQGKQPGHLGLYNVDTILRKHYGEGFGLTLGNRAGGGAEITAVLPAEREEETPC